MRSFARHIQSHGRGERGEGLIETIAAVLILSIFVLGAMVSFQSVLATARTHERLSFLDAAAAQGKAQIEAAPYVVPASYATPAIPPVAFTLSVTQLTERLQQVTLTATYGPTRQVTIFKSPFDVSSTATGGGSGAAPGTTGPPLITSTPPTAATVAQPYSYQAQATGAAPISWSLIDGPAGLTLNATTGLVSWTPDAFGSFGVAIEARNAAGTDRQSFTVAVTATPVITTAPVTGGFVGITYSYQARAVGTEPITWTLVSGPSGMTIEPNQGLVIWPASAIGSYPVTIRATNAVGSQAQSWTITVVTPTTVTLKVTDGWDSQQAKTLVQQNKVTDVQTSDDKRLDIVPTHFISFQFGSVPATATILKVTVFIEHFEEKEVGQGLIAWQVASGALTAPVAIDTIAPTVLIEKENEATVPWEVTRAISDPAKVNDLKLVVRNDNSQNKKTLLDHVYVVVVYKP